jgi:hypothetical protein
VRISINANAELKETFMNTQIYSKFAALAFALLMNTMIIGGMAHLFTAELQPRTTDMAQGVSTVQSTGAAASAV